MRQLWLLILLVISIACGSAAPKPPTYPAVQEAQRDATVALVHGDFTYCSGVWISQTEIVTAAHCVSKNKRGEKIDYALYEDVSRPGYVIRESHKVTVIDFDVETDAAYLAISGPPPHPHGWAPLASGAKDGEPVGVVGHPQGLIYTWMPGNVSRTLRMTGDYGGAILVVQITVPAWYGNSGGPAFNSNGEIVGLASFIGSVPGQTFFVHPTHVKAILGK
jgi:S1-C subfamily serine protease